MENKMSHIEHVNEVIDSFFRDDATSVLVLKGGWGVGKTYFWKKYIDDKIKKKELNHVAYSYLSLFGLNDLKETRSKIFQKGTPLKSDSEMQTALEESEKEQNKMLNLVPSLKKFAKEHTPRLGLFSGWSKELPYLKQVASIITTMEHGLIKNYLICFDDLERKGDNLKIKEVMGLVDELVTDRKCKVVLIFNEASLTEKNEDKQQFDIYREKIVDVEIEYKPTVDENISLVFSNDDPHYSQYAEIFNFLNVSNIRIYKKTKWAIGRIKPSIVGLSQELQEEVVNHLLVFSWSYYNADTNLPLAKVAKKIKSDSWLSSLIKPEENPSPEDAKWNKIASNLALSSAEYDNHLVSLLTEGFLDRTQFEEVLVAVDKKKHEQSVAARLRNAWDIYADSFEDNLTEFLGALKALLDEEIEHIKLYDFCSAIDVLQEYEIKVDDYIDRYLEIHAPTLKKFDFEDRPLHREISNERLKSGLLQLTKAEIQSNLTIDIITEKIYTIRGWNPSDIIFLDSLSVDELYAWMMSNPKDLKRKIRSSLLFFKNLQSSSEEDSKTYKNIARKTEAALAKVAETTPLNKKRVSLIYGIDLDSLVEMSDTALAAQEKEADSEPN